MRLSRVFYFSLVFVKNRVSLVANAPPHLKKARQDTLTILEEALKKVNGFNAVKSAVSYENSFLQIKEKTFPLKSFEHIYLLGFGKASIDMALAIKNIVPIKRGCIITNEKRQIAGISVYQASHPFPEEKNIQATEELLKIGEKTTEKDLIILLISGGGSSLLCKPRISLKGMRKVTESLMHAGCTIEELNTVRKHLSFVKGGQLAKDINGTIISLIISDVVGDKLEFVSSGPAFPDTTTYTDVEHILKKYDIWGKIREVNDIIIKGAKGEIEETPKETFNHVHSFVIANNEMACMAAQKKGQGIGYYSKAVTSSLTGEARKIGEDIVEFTKIHPSDEAIFIFGGETTVVVKGKGKGGRNQELALAAMNKIEGEDIVLLSCGTDGRDGNSVAAGAIIDGWSLENAKKKNLSPDLFLQNNDSHTFFKKLDDVILTRQTGTNVMDLQICCKIG